MAYITIMNTKQNGDTFYSVELCMGFMTAKAMESVAVFLWIELLTKGEVEATDGKSPLANVRNVSTSGRCTVSCRF